MADQDLQAHFDKLIRIGIALSGERDIDALLEMIVDESRGFTRADAGTLYAVSEDGKSLTWKIVQNDTMGTRMGGTSGAPVAEAKFPPVPLVADGQANLSNVSAYVANTGRTVNIPDVYEAEGFDFTGPRRYDAATGYRSTSMLVVPLRDHEGTVIGVLQLLNAMTAERRGVVPFAPEYEGMVTSLASLAAVAITNARLIRDLKGLFDAFIQAIAAAIDEKSHYTGGHIRRVADLTMRLAHEVNRAETGVWGRVRLTADELEELRIAAWMHDVGKVTTPEHVGDKATKLQTIFDRIEAIRNRYEVIKRDAEIAALKEKLRLLCRGDRKAETAAIDAALQRDLSALEEEFEFLARCNAGKEFMADGDLARVQEIASRPYAADGGMRPRLTEDEALNLCIRKGTLTDAEREVINNHVAVTMKILSQLPFSKKLRRVPEYAGSHHEKPNGKGYPRGLTAERLPLQARIMAVADVFEALTAADRPYRKPNSLSQAFRIMGFMVRDGELDGRIVDLLLQSGLAMKYAREELRPEQVDVES